MKDINEMTAEERQIYDKALEIAKEQRALFDAEKKGKSKPKKELPTPPTPAEVKKPLEVKIPNPFNLTKEVLNSCVDCKLYIKKGISFTDGDRCKDCTNNVKVRNLARARLGK